MYYFAINLGSVISTFSLPILQRERGYADAFLVPAVLMAIALGFFAAGKRHYAVETPGTAQAQTPEETAEQWQALLRLAGVFALVVVWWALYDQHDHLWTAFAKAHVNLQLFGYELRPNQLIALNPFCILAFVPLLNLSFKALDPDGRRFPPATKMLIGFLLAILTSGILALASYLAESTGEKVSMGWMVAAFVIQVISEVLVSVVGLELAFAMAPPKMKSQLTACWQVTVFGGNLLNYVIAPYYDGVGPAVFFAAMTALAAGATAAFYFIARRFNQATTPEQAP
jgi:dipeptide/tripeptide permease